MVKSCPDAAGAVVVASVVALDPGGWYPFTVAKWWVVVILVLVAWWAAVHDHARPGRWPYAAMAALVALMAVAALFGREPWYAWVGTPERHAGVLGWLVFLAAVVTGSALRREGRIERFTQWVVVAGGAAGVYALVERYWRAPVGSSSVTDRLGGPYGSASIFGAALCLLLPVCLVASVNLTSRWWRCGAAGSAALCVAALVGSGTRAAWVGIGAVAVVAVAAGAGRHFWDRRWSASRWVLPGVGVVGALLAVGGAGRVTERSAGGGSRLDEWMVGLRIVGEHPWLGAGPEGYRTVLADGIDAAYERDFGRGVIPDRAHNVFLDVAAAGGLGAAALYALVLGFVLWGAWRALRGNDPLAAGVAMGAIAFAAQAMFLFPVATVDPVWWIFAGILVPATTPAFRTRLTTRAVTAVAAVGALAAFAVGIVSVSADRAALRAEEDGVAGAERAVELRPDVVRYRLLLAQARPDTIAGRQAAIDDVDAALGWSPHDPIVLRQHADALTRLAVATGEFDDVLAARNAWRELAARDANCYHCHLGLGYAEALDNDVKAAVAAFERAAELAPEHNTEAADNAERLSGADVDG